MKQSRIHAVSPRAALALLALLVSTSAAVAAEQAATPSLAQLEAGVDAEEAVRAVKRLQHSYGHYLESGMWDDLADLFADDATGQFGTESVSGKSRLRAHFMQQANRKSAGLAKGQLNAHLILQPIITVSADGKTVKGTWHEAAMLGSYGSSATWRGGRPLSAVTCSASTRGRACIPSARWCSHGASGG